jgi:hypothetical protein
VTRSHHIGLRAVATVALLLALAVIAAHPAPAGASEVSCGRQVFLDWWDNDRVDRRIYPSHCYRDAIRDLPVDIRDYSGAEEDILRALAYALQGKPDGGGKGPGGSTASDRGPGTTTSSSTTDPPGETPAPVDTAGPSAVPIPLIVLAAIASALLVLGAAGHLRRRGANDRSGDSPNV